jgi:ABC-2 type transport system ATP-binding protein
MTLVETRDLVKKFGALTAVDHISFTVGRGEVVGFLGPNGAGKSTTMKIISGFLEPTSGKAFIAGHDSHADPITARRHLGYLPEGAPAYSDMSVAAFLEFVAGMHGMTRQKAGSRLAELVERVDLAGVWNQRIESLSKGFKRRVGIAQALIHDPDVLILDEPTDGLDPNQKHEMRSLIRSIAANKAIVVSTHILEEVEAICSRAIIIAKGRMLADATPADLMSHAPGQGSFAVSVDTSEPQRIVDLLSGQPGVKHVEITSHVNGTARFLVHPGSERPSASQLTAHLAKSNIVVEEIYLERARLDEVFRQITRQGVGA